MSKYGVRYLEDRTLRNGLTAFYFNPPKDMRDRGWKTESLGTDRQAAFERANELNKQIDVVRGKPKDTKPAEARPMTVDWLFQKYKDDWRYRKLEPKTKGEYALALGYFAEHKDPTLGRLGSANISAIRPGIVNTVYNDLLKYRGQRMVTLIMSTARRAWLIALINEWAQLNPFSTLTLPRSNKRSVVWTQEDLDKFVSTAEEMGEHSLAMIARCAYELTQRYGDVIRFTWDNYKNTPLGPELWFKQRKTGVEVYVPVHKELAALIERVPPQERKGLMFPSRGGNYVWTQHEINYWFGKVKKKAGINPELRLSDLRRTGLTEMGAAGANTINMMGNSGHKSLEILGIYSKPTREGARVAQEQRWAYREGKNLVKN